MQSRRVGAAGGQPEETESADHGGGGHLGIELSCKVPGIEVRDWSMSDYSKIVRACARSALQNRQDSNCYSSFGPDLSELRNSNVSLAIGDDAISTTFSDLFKEFLSST